MTFRLDRSLRLGSADNMSLDELFGRAQGIVDDGLAPACQLAVARDGELLAFETFGAATNDSQFCAFSATKPIVASMVWLLIGEGLLAPEQRVADLVPEFGTNGKDVITLDQVLLHTAGFPNGPLLGQGADPDAATRRVRVAGPSNGSPEAGSSTTRPPRTGSSSTWSSA